MPPTPRWPSTEGGTGARGTCIESPGDMSLGSAAATWTPPQCGPFPLPRLPLSTPPNPLLGAPPHHRTCTQVLASGSGMGGEGGGTALEVESVQPLAGASLPGSGHREAPFKTCA